MLSAFKISWREKGKRVAIIVTIILLLVMLFPFFVMISTMLKPSTEIYISPPYWLPQDATVQNLLNVWGEYGLLTFFRASAVVALGTMALNIVISVPAAYAVARLRFLGRKIALYMFLAIQMFSPVVIVISLFKIFINLHLIDTWMSLILADTVFTMTFTIWMMTGYFRSIPVEIEESAMIDGCTRVQTITRIMLPIAGPGLVTAMIYTFIWAWNEFLFPLAFIKSQRLMPLTLGLYQFLGRWSTQWELLSAAALWAIIPVLILFYLIEKRLVAGLAAGAVKA
jgi:multiple sugar transport system permease protein